jgi:hypothetical protein
VSCIEVDRCLYVVDHVPDVDHLLRIAHHTS